MFSLIPSRRRGNGSELAERDPFRRMRQEFDGLFNRMFAGFPLAMEDYAPAAAWGFDLRDADKEFVVRAEAPGFDGKDFNINLSGDMLTIAAEHKVEKKKGEEVTEEAWGRFERSVYLPTGVEAEKVAATYKSGVLEIHLPKSPTAIGRKIEVKT